MPFRALPPSLDIFSFWFSPEVHPFWFVKNSDFDDDLRTRFKVPYDELVLQFSAAWLDSIANGETALGYVLMFDQIPRNIFRDTPKAFETDFMAQKITQKTLQKGLEKDLSSLAHHNFLYMPLMHSENLTDQEEGLRLFSRLPNNDLTIAFAQHHLDIIARFGRFPHRNQILGRVSTPEEIEFLKHFSGF